MHVDASEVEFSPRAATEYLTDGNSPWPATPSTSAPGPPSPPDDIDSDKIIPLLSYRETEKILCRRMQTEIDVYNDPPEYTKPRSARELDLDYGHRLLALQMSTLSFIKTKRNENDAVHGEEHYSEVRDRHLALSHVTKTQKGILQAATSIVLDKGFRKQRKKPRRSRGHAASSATAVRDKTLWPASDRKTTAAIYTHDDDKQQVSDAMLTETDTSDDNYIHPSWKEEARTVEWSGPQRWMDKELYPRCANRPAPKIPEGTSLKRFVAAHFGRVAKKQYGFDYLENAG